MAINSEPANHNENEGLDPTKSLVKADPRHHEGVHVDTSGTSGDVLTRIAHLEDEPKVLTIDVVSGGGNEREGKKGRGIMDAVAERASQIKAAKELERLQKA